VADTVVIQYKLYFLDITALQPIQKDGHTWYRAEVVRRDDSTVAKDTVQIDSTRSIKGSISDNCGMSSWLPDTLLGPFPHPLTLDGREYRTRTQTSNCYDNLSQNPRYITTIAVTSVVEERMGLIYRTGILHNGPLSQINHRTTIRLRRFNDQPFDVDRFQTIVQTAVRRKSPNPAYSKPASPPGLFLFEGRLHDTRGRIRPPRLWRQAE
jgi:hypothetical protein